MRKQRVLRRKPRTPAKATPQAAVDTPLRRYLTAFLSWSEARYSAATVQKRKVSLEGFLAWCAERDIAQLHDLSRDLLERYQRHLYDYRKTDGQPLTIGTQLGLLHSLQAFCKWLTRQRYILYNPAAELELPKAPRRLPHAVLSREEVESVLNQPDLTTLMGLRNRTILETLYASGVRKSELVQLTLHDLDLPHGTLRIRQGKGNKDRIVPIGERACAWLTKYLDDVRPALVVGADDGQLFLTDYGEMFSNNRLNDMVRKYLNHAGIDRPGACHMFRHACATHMLDNGADLRALQLILGHAQITTTEIYTHVSIGRLKAVHAATHPAAHLRLGSAE
ncbi:site-specific tyrosine recombinase XerC [Chitinimonas sp. BJB300]|uniref:site-specific tyrosine recombinase XerC n=1 Tax=Chitinimonas sp. BJB300 TaxID=1559339 RepID=UPI000C0ECC90|nr:site-specific tyrosine recombinase XerC [Chitinimonas sp. BJB300]PHV09789.1 recombinase XerD [Chitinimonas sp. BJB300]TSJ83038.1 site-specific tyrosine recombinase XerC [Chitinimonas sp. BJB300]